MDYPSEMSGSNELHWVNDPRMRTDWLSCYLAMLSLSRGRIMILMKLWFKKLNKDLQKHPASLWNTTEYI